MSITNWWMSKNPVEKEIIRKELENYLQFIHQDNIEIEIQTFLDAKGWGNYRANFEVKVSDHNVTVDIATKDWLLDEIKDIQNTTTSFETAHILAIKTICLYIGERDVADAIQDILNDRKIVPEDNDFSEGF